MIETLIIRADLERLSQGSEEQTNRDLPVGPSDYLPGRQAAGSTTNRAARGRGQPTARDREPRGLILQVFIENFMKYIAII